jgi:hypothetical protein
MEKCNAPGIFTLVLASCAGASIATLLDYATQQRTEEKVDKLLRRPTVKLMTENVIGSDANDVFYNIGERRAYLEIDGRSVEDYVQSAR